jgi:hypothetical protein
LAKKTSDFLERVTVKKRRGATGAKISRACESGGNSLVGSFSSPLSGANGHEAQVSLQMQPA